MHDLFESMKEEVFQERSAIMEFDGLMSRDDAERLAMLDSEKWREACEVRYVLDIKNLSDRREYFQTVQKHRGEKATQTLKEIVKKEWERRRAE